ncbi:MAG: hypothetical protein ACLQKA_02000 [Bryobacteraceae bacterium]
MAEYVALLNHLLDGVLDQLGLHEIGGLQASIGVVGATVFLGFCVAVHSATRIAFMRCSVRK